MLKILIQKLLTGRLSTLGSLLLLKVVRRSPRAMTELEQQESAEAFLAAVRHLRRKKKEASTPPARPPWEDPTRPVPMNPPNLKHENGQK